MSYVRIGCFAALCASCSLLNSEDPCADVRGTETIVNARRQENNESLEHGRHLARVSDTRALVAFQALDFDYVGNEPETHNSSARIALLSIPSGANLTTCSEEIDRDVSDPARFASEISIVPAPLTVVGERAAALVGWIDGKPYSSHRVAMRFVDDAGCPLGIEGEFDPFDRAATRLSMAWSARKGAVLAVMHDERSVYSAWISEIRQEEAPLEIARGSNESALIQIFDSPVVAVAEDGRAFVAWFDSDRGFRGLTLSSSGSASSPFDLGIPVRQVNGNFGVACAVSAGPNRFVVAASASETEQGTPVAYFREFSLAGEPLGGPKPVAPEDDGVQTVPNAAYLPSGTLFISWHSSSARGTVGRFFDPDGAPRFCAIGCNDQPFALGRQSTDFASGSVIELIGGDVWVVHGGADTRGMGVFLWRAPYADLFPVVSN